MHTSHHISKLLADERITELNRAASKRAYALGGSKLERRTVRAVRRLSRSGETPDQVSVRPPHAVPERAEGTSR